MGRKIPDPSGNASDLAPLPASSQYWGWTAEAVAAVEAEAEPLAEVRQLPGTTPRPAAPPRGTRDQRRAHLPEPGSPDRFAMLPEHVLRSELQMVSRVLYAELQRAIDTGPPWLASLRLCTVTLGMLAANLHTSRDSVRRALVELAAAGLIEYRAEDDNARGLRVRVPWTPPKRRPR
jgi:hypothetical protein